MLACGGPADALTDCPRQGVTIEALTRLTITAGAGCRYEMRRTGTAQPRLAFQDPEGAGTIFTAASGAWTDSPTTVSLCGIVLDCAAVKTGLVLMTLKRCAHRPGCICEAKWAVCCTRLPRRSPSHVTMHARSCAHTRSRTLTRAHTQTHTPRALKNVDDIQGSALILAPCHRSFTFHLHQHVPFLLHHRYTPPARSFCRL